ncbi:MAG TPA: tRNA glutamyl-Q(34) synthetase GluQRS [Polyangiaceae bacterium]|nr:tRNA glutamyl-Q(34) synthetase GluQRS [Polyangiaceae bacterium]
MRDEGYRGRFAPSPTGELHLGSAATAIFCAAAARAAGGRLILRVEDLDRDRVVAGGREAMLRDLRWIGVAWDEGPDVGGPAAPYDQSQRIPLYERAVEDLAERGLTYLCDCSRAEIARAASAPHAGEEGPRYPGTCRPHGHRPRAFRRPPAVRLAVPEGGEGVAEAVDAVLGRLVEDVSATTGDFVLRRGDGVFAYQLAVVVDDLAMGVTDVVRGADLASSAPRQALLARLLGGSAPRFAHIPLLLGEGGARLAKRARSVTIREQRDLDRDPEDLVRSIARAYGHDLPESGDPISALAASLSFSRLAGRTVTLDQILPATLTSAGTP